MSQRIMVRIGISALLYAVFLLHNAGWLGHDLLDELEASSYDARLLLTLPRTVDKRIVIVDVDEKSLAAEGQWPWPRSKLADFVTELFQHYGAKALGFDILFAERDRTSVGPLLDSLAKGPLADLPGFAARVPVLSEQLDNDRRFAAALAGKPVVMGMIFKQHVPEGETAATGSLCAPLVGAEDSKALSVDFYKPVGYAASVPELAAAAPACGFFDVAAAVDHDGQFRRVPLVQEYQGQLYPSLALAVARLALGNPAAALEFDPPEHRDSLHLEDVALGDKRAPVDGQVDAYVPFRGPQGSFPYVSATDVLHGAVDPAVLKDAIVLVGTTAAGQLDLRSTPLSSVFPGVEIHANLISGLLDGRIKQKPTYYNGIEAVLLLAIAAVMALLYPRLSPIRGALLVLALIAGETGLAFAAWNANFIVPLGIPIVFTLALFLSQLLYGYFVESRKLRQTSKVFGQYIPPELVEELAENPEAVSMAGENREMTVLFSDIRGFTTISEKFRDRPHELAELMNEFLGLLTEVIFRHRGTIDKYMGDAIMAFWGAPLENPQHALAALQAAMEFPVALRKLDARFEERGWPKLHVGVGLNTGSMTVGNMGSEFRIAYTVLGDAVNLGSRLEGATKKYGVEVICSDTTRDGAPDWAFRELDLVRVKGKSVPVTIYEPLGPKDAIEEALRQDLLRLRAALRAHRAQRWDEAEREFFGLSRSGRPHPMYELYLERIAEFRSHSPPADWDGATNFETK